MGLVENWQKASFWCWYQNSSYWHSRQKVINPALVSMETFLLLQTLTHMLTVITSPQGQSCSELAPHYHSRPKQRRVAWLSCISPSTVANICCCLLLSPDPLPLAPSTNCCLLTQGNEARPLQGGEEQWSMHVNEHHSLFLTFFPAFLSLQK